MNGIDSLITEQLKNAMKARDSLTLNTLRALKSAIKTAALDKGGAAGELDKSESLAIVRKLIKQRQDSIESFDSAGRTDLADKERAEINVLRPFLPPELSETELNALIESAIVETGATSRKDMGTVMKILQVSTDGRVDGKILAASVTKRLS